MSVHADINKLCFAHFFHLFFSFSAIHGSHGVLTRYPQFFVDGYLRVAVYTLALLTAI